MLKDNIKTELNNLLKKLKSINNKDIVGNDNSTFKTSVDSYINSAIYINAFKEIVFNYITTKYDTFTLDGFSKSLNSGLLIKNGSYVLSDNVVVGSLLYDLFSSAEEKNEYYDSLLKFMSETFNCTCNDDNFKVLVSEYVLKVGVDFIIKVSLQRNGDINVTQNNFKEYLSTKNIDFLVTDCDIPMIANALGCENISKYLKCWNYDIDSYVRSRSFL